MTTNQVDLPNHTAFIPGLNSGSLPLKLMDGLLTSSTPNYKDLLNLWHPSGFSLSIVIVARFESLDWLRKSWQPIPT